MNVQLSQDELNLMLSIIDYFDGNAPEELKNPNTIDIHNLHRKLASAYISSQYVNDVKYNGIPGLGGK